MKKTLVRFEAYLLKDKDGKVFDFPGGMPSLYMDKSQAKRRVGGIDYLKKYKVVKVKVVEQK